ncbi:polysaccharide export protein : Polysaccharide export protein OS=Rhodopirellula maiorica SM1 GN=RMSM_04496 PE=4 SV=1: Poly_export: Poly_export [Gemmata massiliana]|uniref:Polysaccharide export protein N-terminal domain-containing protein n=1 Tax=Gemmata massiliana TaxID=1210884 RepID=A0A6P2D6B6_9BACT|nr:polysaccharide biosynthesis/export family protein [Gemmata massiliana]VTR95674.1 polysaccharide export protein : Polysaccharide export protein OS=Rhodopirellula maiorica SM1 GN=RMSM_04496 PE=4 SV=1: Poly_export: Poly_export [Gemmata massiliana]
MNAIRKTVRPTVILVAAVLAGSGCLSAGPRTPITPPPDLPRELVKVSLPDYRVEPPDVLLIEAVRAIPKPPYRAEPLDVLFVSLADPAGDPLSGPVSVESDGTVNLGASYGGSVKVVGLTIPEIRALLEDHLEKVVKLKAPRLTVTLAQGRAAQRINGPHLVRQDGTVSLGTYGSVRVSGLTLAEIRQALESHLSAYLEKPEISVDVQGYNSKLFYVIQDGGGVGQTVTRLPVTGNETVLDAISQLNGLSPVASQDRIWVSRPAPVGASPQILPVDWRAITECGDTSTNYQLMPGDRVFVAAYPMVRVDTTMARLFAPIERVLGITSLGTGTAKQIRFFNSFNGSGGGGGFGP